MIYNLIVKLSDGHLHEFVLLATHATSGTEEKIN